MKKVRTFLYHLKVWNALFIRLSRPFFLSQLSKTGLYMMLGAYGNR